MKQAIDKSTKEFPEFPQIPAPIFIRAQYNYDTKAASDASGLSCPEPTLAQQQFKEECDINTIVERFNITGRMPENVPMPQSADFDRVFDFQSALNQVIEARHAFEKMPAKIRTRFDNDPQKFIKFCDDPENLPEAELLGLVKKIQPEPKEAPVEITETAKAVT